jgi:hypothetical protein
VERSAAPREYDFPERTAVKHYLTRRRFMAASLAAVPAALAARAGLLEARGADQPLNAATRRALGIAVPEQRWHGDSSVRAAARANPRIYDEPDERRRPRRPRPDTPPTSPPTSNEWQRFAQQLSVYRDLRRHFIFEYYPWYQANPFQHWEENRRVPPIDIASFAFPLLGAYDSRDAKIIEQHARWIAEMGAGAINVSWWGQGSREDRAVPLIMDVMRAHDIHVTFHIEPYADDRANRLAEDIVYLIREYGEKRRWDAFLLMQDADGTARPMFKSFATILARTVTDCRGRTFANPLFAEDSLWRRQTDTVRNALRSDFDPIMLADTLDANRTEAGGFDGMAMYDAYYRPALWAGAAAPFSAKRLLFSFNTNPGFDKYPERPPFGECFSPLPFEPPIAASGWGADAREQALLASRDRVLEALRTTLTLQLDPASSNRRRGFFAMYINSFNEWHEGTAFEPALDFAALSPEQRAIGYHNPDNGRWRMQLIQELLTELARPN